EQAQPNVVMYTELNPSSKRFLEIVIKNFGSTPAYNVKTVIDPPLKATPNNVSKGKLADVPIPEFPILAPGQEWRTGWDFYLSRKRHNKKWGPLAGKTESELAEDEKLTIQAQMSYTGGSYSYEQVIADMTLPSVHMAEVTYQDSHRRTFTTQAVLDANLFKDTTWLDIKTVHNLVKVLEKQLEEQNRGLTAIHRRLAEFGTEHEGIWVYNSADDEEREFRLAIKTADLSEKRDIQEHFDYQLFGGQSGSPLPEFSSDDVEKIAVEDARANDRFIPTTGDNVNIHQSWRIAYIRAHNHSQFGLVYDLYTSQGEFIRIPAATEIHVIRTLPGDNVNQRGKEL
ncbi:hypothetical protein, partial [Mycolicibacterium diernhoferi]